MEYKRKSYIVKGNKLTKPLPPVPCNNIDDKFKIYFQNLLKGYITETEIINFQPHEVRIFLSSTFTDFKVERNIFITQIIPKLRQTCNNYGLNLRLCDMRWGITDSAVNEHLVEKLCLREIETCHKTSVGPYFILLIGNRYGYKPVPNELPSSEYEMLYSIILENFPKNANIFTKWFLKDENSQPPVHILLPIKTHIPDYANIKNEVERRESGHKWWRVEESIRRCLHKACRIACNKQLLSTERKNQLTRSVIETEFWSAIMGSNSYIDKKDAARCLVYERQLNGLLSDLQSEAAVKYIDYVTRDDEIIYESAAQNSLHEFKKSINKIGFRHFRKFSVPWISTGVTVELMSHKAYLDGFADTVVQDIKELIVEQMTAIQKCSKGMDNRKLNLQSEIQCHWAYCHKQSSFVCGRSSQLRTVIQLISDSNTNPIVIHGNSGCGKTVFIAKIAFELQQALSPIVDPLKSNSPYICSSFTANQSPVIILRFIGISPSTSTVDQLLFSLCFQIQLAYGLRVKYKKMKSLSGLKWLFNYLLQYISQKYGQNMPLIIILDSLDQIQRTSFTFYGKPIPFNWIPANLPFGVYIILSFATENILDSSYKILSDELMHFKDQFIHIGNFESEDFSTFLQIFLQFHQRKLTDQQMALVTSKFLQNPQPLYIKVVLEQARSWQSFLPESEWIVEDTLKSVMDSVFSKLEIKFGHLLISYTISYLSLGRNGLSEAEIEDLLSLRDDVLSEVYGYHDPPNKEIIRLPSLLWTRIYADLSSYIIENNIGNKVILSWCHSLIHQCAVSRYINVPEVYKQLHSDMAKYYSISENCKISCNIQNDQRNLILYHADRLLSCSSINVKEPRKLHALPYHLMAGAEEIDLVRLCVTNLDFLISYAKCFGVQELIFWIAECEHCFQDNQVICAVKQCLVFAYDILEKNINELPVQLLGQFNRLDKLITDEIPNETISNLRSLCQQCETNSGHLVPIFGAFPSYLGPKKLCREEIERIIQFSDNPDYIILIGHHKDSWIIRLFQLSNMVTICSINMENKPKSVSIPSQNRNNIFILDCENVYIFGTATGQLDGKYSLLTKKVILNECLNVNHNGKWIAIAAENRIAILEHQTSNLEKDPLICKWMLTAREVDKTISLCFIQSAVHNLLVTVHTYNSKTQKTFLVKVWQFEQNNELWSANLQTVSSHYDNCVYLWSFERHSASETSENNSSCKEPLLIFLPSGRYFFVENLLDSKSLHLLTKEYPAKLHMDKLQSLSTDGKIFTVVRMSEGQTFVQTVNRYGNVLDINLPDKIIPNTISYAASNYSTSCVLIGLKSGIIYFIHNQHFQSWVANRGTIDYLTHLQTLENNKTKDIVVNIITYSQLDKIFKFLTKTIGSRKNIGKMPENLFEKMNSFAFSSINNNYVIMDENCSNVHSGNLDSIDDGIKTVTLHNEDKSHSTMALESVSILEIEIVLQDQAVLIFYFTKIKLFNITNGQLWANLDVDSKHLENVNETNGKQYWNCVFNTNEILVLTFKKLTGYFNLDCFVLPSFQNIRWSKRFLPPINYVDPSIQLEKLFMVINKNQKFLVLQWKNCKFHTESVHKELIQKENAYEFMSLNLKDPSQTLCLIPCFNQEEAKKISVKNNLSKTTNQIVYSYAIPNNIPYNFPNDVLLSSTILLGGYGEILIWDMETGTCRLPKVPNFQTWFKHSAIINVSTECDSEYKSSRPNKRNSISNLQAKKSPITSLLITNGCSIAISGCASGFIIIWKWAETVALNFNEPDYVNNYRFILSVKHEGEVTALTVDSDQKLLASGSTGMEIFLSNILINQCLQKMSIHCSPLSFMIKYQKTVDDIDGATMKAYLICKALHIGQTRMLAFDLVEKLLENGEK